jgi:hypothetical protein
MCCPDVNPDVILIYGFWVILGAIHVPIRGIRANRRKAAVWRKTHTSDFALFWVESSLVVSTFVILFVSFNPDGFILV